MYLAQTTNFKIIVFTLTAIAILWAASRIESSLAHAITDALTPRAEKLEAVMGHR
jgi:hypothetical protein